MKITIVILTGVLMLGCAKTCGYITDFGYLNSAKANMDEFPVKINDTMCMDSAKRMGACLLRVKDNQDTEIRIIPRPYSYTLKIYCSPDLGYQPLNLQVEPNRDYVTIISKELYENITGDRSFICRGAIFPDSGSEIAISFRFNMVLVKAKYQEVEQAYKEEEIIVLGKHAKSTTCLINDKWEYFEKRAYIDAKNVKMCYAESESGRTTTYLGKL